MKTTSGENIKAEMAMNGKIQGQYFEYQKNQEKDEQTMWLLQQKTNVR